MVFSNVPSEPGAPRQSKQMSRRRFLSRGATFATAAATGPVLLSSCGGGSRGGEGPLRFWQFYAPGGPNPAQEKWFLDLVDTWNKQNERQIKLEYIADYINSPKLQTSFSAGQGPDIFVISPGDFLRYYNGGVLQDLTPYMSKEAQNDYFPDVAATRMVDRKFYGLPMEVEPMAFFYSVKAFEDAGLSEADVPTTWEGLLDVAGKLKKGKRFGALFETAPGYYQNFAWYPFMWMGGGDVVAKDGKTSAFDSPGTAAALEFWQQAIESGVAPRKSLGYGSNDIVANLASGYCAMQNCGIWGISNLAASKPDFEYGVFKLPLPPGGTYTTDLGGWAFCANSKGKDPDTASEFCVWAIGSMEKGSIDRVLEWCTKVKSDMIPRKSVQQRATEEGAFDSGPMKVFKEEIYPGGRAEPRYPPEVYKPVSDAIQACQLDGKDPKQQSQRAAQRIESFLQGYSGAPIL